MKKSILIILNLAIMTACGSSTATVTPAASSQITMKVDGVLWTGAASGLMVDSGTLVVDGINGAASETLGIIIGQVTAPGTFKVKARTGNTMIYSQKGAVIYDGFNDGQVIVTAINTVSGKQVPSGTFTGTFTNSSGKKYIITEGKF